LRVSPGQSNRPVQRHDRLACAGTAAYPGRPAVVAVDQPPLRRMQEDRPLVPRVIEGSFEFLDIGQHLEPALRVGMGERIGLDRRPFRHRRGGAGRQVQQGLGSLLRQPFGDVEQGVLVGSPDLIEPFGRHSVAEQRIVGDPLEQQRFRCGSRCDYGRCGDILDPLGEFDELGCTRRRVAFYPASLGPRISFVVVLDITKQQAGGRSMDDQANVFIDANRPEIRVAGPFKPMEAQARARQVQLKIKRRRLDRLLLRPVQPGEARGEGIGDAEFHYGLEFGTQVVRSVETPRRAWDQISALQLWR
jgi:hypothetical protein